MRTLIFLLMAVATLAQNNQSSPMQVRPNGARTLPGTVHVWDTSNVASLDITSAAIGSTNDGQVSIGTAAKRINVIEAIQYVARDAASGSQRCELTEEVNCFDSINHETFRIRPDNAGTAIFGIVGISDRFEIITGISRGYTAAGTLYYTLDPAAQDMLLASTPSSGSVTAIRGITSRSSGFGGRFENNSNTAGSLGALITSAAGPALTLVPGGAYPDIAFNGSATSGLFLNRAGAPSGTCGNGSMWFRNNGAAGSAGYYCIATAWVAVF